MKSNNIPVLLMLFNRSETTQKVFDSLKIAKPTKLYIAANGPRPNTPLDIKSCAAVREIFNDIDWPCEVHMNYREVNIGMQPHWRLALDWFFENVDAGIVLEDDCVPHVSFFSFCEELLERYRDNENIMHINGSNFQFGQKRGDASYYFSSYPHVWGWATWKRAWKKYDNKMLSFPDFKNNKVIDLITTGDSEKKYWMKYFSELYSGSRDGCDVKWLYTIWANRALCATPNVNMVTNIGFGPTAEHTIFKDRNLDQVSFDIEKIIHPQHDSSIARNVEADSFVFKEIFYKTFFQKVYYYIALRIYNIIRLFK